MTDFFDRLAEAQALDIRDEARRLGLDLDKTGKAWFRPGGRGPKGGSPSGRFYRKGGSWRWYEFSEGVGGDVVDLVQYVTDCSGREALDTLLGADRPSIPQVRYEEPEDFPEVPYKTRAAACGAFYDALPPLGDGARAWLESTRGLTSATVSKFGLRQCDEDVAMKAMEAAMKAVGAEAVISLGLARVSKKSGLLSCPMGWGCWIAIPYRGKSKIGHLQFRRFHRNPANAKKGPKYLHVRGEVPYPFNAAALENGEYPTMLTEGAFDAMVQEQHDFPAVGIPGTSWLRSPGRVRAIAERAQAVVFAFDADKAGREAGDWVCPAFLEAGAEVQQVVWPQGFEGDWCDLYASDGPKNWTVEPWAPPPPPKPKALLDWDTIEEEAIDLVVGEATGQTVRPGLRTGFTAIDEYVRFLPDEFIVVGARPSVGKSHLLLSFCDRMWADSATETGFLSLEMSRRQLGERIAKARLGIGRELPKDTGSLVLAARTRLESRKRVGVNIVCPDDKGETGVLEALDMLRENGARCLMVDYLQYINAKGKNIEERTANASSLLKEYGKKHQIPVVAAAMVKRPENDRHAAKPPTINHLRGSGRIEQDADIIFLAHYPWQHDPESYPKEFRTLYLRKNRNGTLAERPFEIEHDAPFGFFRDLGYRSSLGASERQERAQRWGG